jgi:hypothetical protein
MGIPDSSDVYQQMYPQISELLASLAREHVLEEFRENSIQLTEQGHILTQEFLTPFLAVITGSVPKAKRDALIRHATSNSEAYTSFLLSYIPFSKGAMRKDFSSHSLDARILFALQEFGGNGLTSRQIMDMFDTKLTTTGHAVSRLLQSGSIVQKRIAGSHEFRYYLPAESEA